MVSPRETYTFWRHAYTFWRGAAFTRVPPLSAPTHDGGRRAAPHPRPHSRATRRNIPLPLRDPSNTQHPHPFRRLRLGRQHAVCCVARARKPQQAQTPFQACHSLQASVAKLTTLFGLMPTLLRTSATAAPYTTTTPAATTPEITRWPPRTKEYPYMP